MRRTVDAKILVPGDVVFVLSGDRMPADLRWVQINNLQVGVEGLGVRAC